MKKLTVFMILGMMTAKAFATTISGESAYCLTHCINGICQPVNFKLGQKNATIGLPLLVPFVTQTGTELKAATSYSWGQTGAPLGAATNLTGITTDLTNAFTFSQVTMKDSGLYAETGSAPATPFDVSGGTVIFNWCVTVNAAAVLDNNLLFMR